MLDVEAARAADALTPVVPDLERVTAQLKTLASVESKEGRTLSGANADRLAAAVQHLVAVLAAAGIDWQQPRQDPPPSPDPQSKAVTTALHPKEISAALALFADARTAA